MEYEKHVFVKTFIEYAYKVNVEDPVTCIKYFFYPEFLKLFITNLNEDNITDENIKRLYSYFCDLYEYTKDIQKINKIDKNLPFELNYNYVCWLEGGEDFFAFNINLSLITPLTKFKPTEEVKYYFTDKNDFKTLYKPEDDNYLFLYSMLFAIENDDDDDEYIDPQKNEEEIRELMFRSYIDYDEGEDSDSSQKSKSTIIIYI